MVIENDFCGLLDYFPQESSRHFKFWYHVKDPAKGQEQAIDRNISAHIFLPIRDTPRNVYIERKLRISRFRKNKFFWFLMLFCIQNGIWVKMWVFGFLRSEHKILATGKTSASYWPIFYWERGYMHKNMILSFFVPFCNQNGIWGVGNFGHQQFLGRKIDFFRFFKNVF